jgi:predicted unusual protein kinase regulating ubiquinone biosynthesis (AarF/ABC1/UbiB family)
MMKQIARFVKTCDFAAQLNIIYKRVPNDRKKIWLKKKIEDMGPTYIKIGQFLGSRPDIVQDPYVMSTLQMLYDEITPIPWDYVKEVTKDMTQRDNCFIEEIPIATASIGQVHRGKSETGQDIVIKIKRPNVDEDIQMDLNILNTYIKAVSYLLGKDDPKIIDSKSILRDLRIILNKEADFVGEVKNMLLMSTTLPSVNIPTPITKYCNSNMIVMNYIPSIQLTKEVEDKKRYATLLMNLFIDQFLKFGIMHGDPHEGNVRLSQDGDNIVMYDFGSVIQLDKKKRSLMKMLVFEIISENVDGVIDVIKEMPDIITIRDETMARNMIQIYIDYIKTIDVNVLKQAVFEDKNLPFRFSDIIFQITRVFGMVEGICIQLDPDFKYEKIFINHIETLILDEDFIRYKIKSDMKRFF